MVSLLLNRWPTHGAGHRSKRLQGRSLQGGATTGPGAAPAAAGSGASRFAPVCWRPGGSGQAGAPSRSNPVPRPAPQAWPQAVG